MEERKRVLSPRPTWWPAGRRAWGPERGACLRVAGFGRVADDTEPSPGLMSRLRLCLFHSQNCVDAYPTFLVVLWSAGLLCSQGEVWPSERSLLGPGLGLTEAATVPGLRLRSGKP